MNIQKLSEKIKNSPFSLKYYSIQIPLKRTISSIFPYTHQTEEELPLIKIFESVPEFQRANDKWNEHMQIKFIENIILGFRPTLMFYELSNKSSGVPQNPVKIIDGLQRLTAIYRFLSGEIKAFGFGFDELVKENVIAGMSQLINIQIFTFKKESEAVEFYIAMNENITHSSDDIQKAKNYLNKIKMR